MEREKKETILRTIRIAHDLDNILQKDAEDSGVNVNTLITKIITKYAEWDRFADKFGFISLPRDAFRFFLGIMDEEKLKKFAIEYGSTVPKEFMMFRFKKVDSKTALEVISLFCKFAGNAQYDVETNGKDYTVTLHHDLGENWSRFLGYIVAEGMFKNVVGIIPKYEITGSSLIIQFSQL